MSCHVILDNKNKYIYFMMCIVGLDLSYMCFIVVIFQNLFTLNMILDYSCLPVLVTSST